MKIAALAVGLCLGLTPVATETALAQSSTTRYVTVDGVVLSYDAGRVVVIRGADGRETTYKLPPTVAMPADMGVGRHVTLYTEPGENGGTQVVTRVTTTTVTPNGNIKKTTEDTRTLPSGATTTTTTTQFSGQVEAYTAGKTLTILRSDGTRATYVITEKSAIPTDLMIGRTVAVVPVITTNANGELVVRTVTYVPVKPNN